ncbi:MAG TPA: RagB/SusD family nutrient uptake outer membrane protein [Prolixibacteraceae bacterium]|nr:RagB/SusD family nutrient uptake outer membrane protein [Prolixibacteraceae bacterium]
MKNITWILLIALLFAGCEEYLDKVPDSDGMTEEQVFTDYLNFKKFQDRMYKDMHDYLADYDYSFIAAVCDEGTTSCRWETLPVVQNGDWLRSYSLAQALQFSTPWRAWESIRIANMSLQRLSVLENASAQQKDELKGQAHFMRAWYYYEFLRRQGGMPYLTRPLIASDNFAIPRLSFEETARMIAADCDTAFSLLPVKWNNNNYGRPTKGAALAVKASTFLFNASPSNNPSNDPAKWEEAAQAAWDLIQFSEENSAYKLEPCQSTDNVSYMTPEGVKTIEFTGGYDSIFNHVPFNDEIIWEFASQMQNGGRYTTFSTTNLVTGGIIQGYSPSQNMVDLFETANGLSIADDPAFDEQNPYVNRDPRFYHCILFNRERWTSKTDYYLSLYNGGEERQALDHFSKTGYLARKFWVNNIDQWSDAAHPISHCIYFRYAEVLMWYAEACNELGGPNHTLSGANLSALDAVNRVRSRVGMPGVDARYLADKNSFRERIKNERAIEFFLEGKRFFDLSRWGDASKVVHKEIYGINILEDATKPTGYVFNRSTEPIVSLTFDQKHYKWPIPLADATMFEEVKQNPGW